MKLLDILLLGGAGLVAIYLLRLAGEDVMAESNLTLPHKVLERGLCPENAGFQCD